MNNMKIASSRGVLLSLLLLAAAITTSYSMNDVFAADKVVNAKSIGFEKTTIIEFENNGKTDIETFRLWLSGEMTFQSFKTEKGWTGKKTPQGVIVFTSTAPIESGESVKFGIKTDKEKPGINWKALDEDDEQIEIGKTLVSDIPPVKDSEDNTNENTQNVESTDGILSDSIFRLVPEKPRVGSNIRVTGDNFGAEQKLDLYLDNKKLEDIETNENGYFMITTQIPENEDADRVNFIVKDKQGNEKKLSIRLGVPEDRLTVDEVVDLTIKNLPSIMHRGDVIIVSGTANPGGSVTSTITNPDGEVITTDAAEVDSKGNWSVETIIPLDAPLGKYSAEITDGKESILRSWEIESGETIQLLPVKLKFEPGEAIVFNGTATPKQNLDIVLENPQGSEVFSDNFVVDASGFVEFEFATTQADLEGTYILFAFQGEESTITLVGLGELPEEQLIVKSDKLNYNAGSTAILALDGPPSSTASLLVIDPSDKNKFSDNVQFGPDGKAEYKLDLKGYSSGVYTVVITRGNSQTEDVFSVGLQTGSGEISISTTKTTYEPSDQILILGDSNANILVTVALIDPDGNEVKEKTTFTNKEGKLSLDSFRIPSDAVSGMWKITARSGPNNDTTEIEVVTETLEGLVVSVTGFANYPGIGDVVDIKVLGTQQAVFMKVYSSDDELVGELGPISGSAGEITTPWPVPKDLPPGTYKIVVNDPFNEATTTFELEP